MAPLAHTLRKLGYRAQNVGYISIRGGVEFHAEWFGRRLKRLAEETPGSVHIVAHSMGGIVARAALLQERPANLGRMVMLGVPNGGSHIARKLARFNRSLRDLSDDEQSYVNRLGNLENLDIGVLAAELDRVIHLPKTRIAGMRELLVLPGQHWQLPLQPQTLQLVPRFLETGSFQPDTLEGEDPPLGLHYAS